MSWKKILKEEKRSAEEILSDLAVNMAFGENDLYNVAKNFERKGFKTSVESNGVSLTKNGKLIGTILFNMPLDDMGYHDDPIEDILMGEEERKNTLEMLG
tara:strand:- start:676 stop:975 length:300 start_codon:yes stop_codon:yes gene_type:complete